MQLFGHHLSRLFSVAFLTTFALAAFETTFAMMIPRCMDTAPTGIGALLAFAGLMQALAQGYLVGKIVKSIGELDCSRPASSYSRSVSHRWRICQRLRRCCSRSRCCRSVTGSRAPQSRASSRNSRERDLEGEALGINQSASSIARISGPLAGGLAYGTLGASAPYVGGAIVALMAFILARGIEDGAVASARGEQFGRRTGWLLVFHLFGVIFWIGSLLLIASLLAWFPMRSGSPKERFIMIASRLFFGGCNIGGTVAIVFGILLMVAEPEVLRQGWLHVKLATGFHPADRLHVRLYQRIVALSDNPSSVSGREFRVIHGMVEHAAIGILALAVIKPF